MFEQAQTSALCRECLDRYYDESCRGECPLCQARMRQREELPPANAGSSTQMVEIVDPSGKVSYRRPAGDPMIAEALRTSGYSVRLFDTLLPPPTPEERQRDDAEDVEYFRQKVIEQAGIPPEDDRRVGWCINPAFNGGVDGWVSIYKESAGPNCPFGFVHEDEAELIVEMRKVALGLPPSALDASTTANGWTGKRCPTCKGLGDVFDHERQEDVPCPACGGTGDEFIVRPLVPLAPFTESIRPVMEQMQQDMVRNVMGLPKTPADLPVPPCRVCSKTEDILIYDRDRPERSVCPTCCGSDEHHDGETGHVFSERDIGGPFCTYCGLRRECVEWQSDND